MTSLPLPFVVALLLALLAASNQPQLNATPSGRVFAAILYINAFSMVLIGLRWSLDMPALLSIAAPLSILSAALLYLAFRSLGRAAAVLEWPRDWPHLALVAFVAVCTQLFPLGVDIVITACKILYALLLLLLLRNSPDSLQLVRLSWLKNSQQALWGAVLLLLSGAALDIVIALDFIHFEGRHAARLVSVASLITLLLLGWASILAGRARAGEDHAGATAQPDASAQASPRTQTARAAESVRPHRAGLSDADEAALLDKLNTLLVDDRLYADTELNLQRLARKSGIPGRTISRLVNASLGLNISQWVNKARIDAACELLEDDSISVQQAMQDAGFLTKSNFNREFRRVKGCSPSQWRRRQTAASG